MAMLELRERERQGRKATEERAFRLEQTVEDLERRLTDLEGVMSEQLECRTEISSVATSRYTCTEDHQNKNRIHQPWPLAVV